MRPPISRLKKAEIVWLANHYCKHRHSYLSHYQCYLDENPLGGNAGYFDIETSNLNANFGMMFGYCILDDAGEIHESWITKKDMASDFDKRVVRDCINDLRKFDKVITFYGTKFDLPYVRTRAEYWGLDFPGYGEFVHEDVYYIIRHKFKLSSNRLESACRMILGETEKTHIDPDMWMKALRCDKEAIDYIQHHCQGDVRDLKRLYDRVIKYRKRIDRSG